MQHPPDTELNAFLDGELGNDAAHSVQAHWAACPECQAKLSEWSRLSVCIREIYPALTAFRSECEFWADLAAKLPQTQCEAWPLLEYLPPLALAVLGALLRALMSLVSTAYSLVNWGVFPRLGPLVSQQLMRVVSAPFAGRSFSAWVGQPNEWIVHHLARSWDSLSSTGQEAIVFGSVWATLVLLFGVVVAFYWLWATCRSSGHPDQNGGH